MSKLETIVQKHKANFEMLTRAFKSGDVCLMDCIDKATKKHIAVICAMNRIDGETEMVPIVQFFNGNPYEMLISPLEYEK